MKFITKGEQETYDLGVRLGCILKPGAVISLNGDLGAGKTHFTKGIATGLGITDYITSPSFTIVNEYDGNMKLYHFDVYRIDDLGEMYEIGFEEYLYGQGVCVVEWGKMVKELLPDDTINIEILRIDDATREILIDSDISMDVEKDANTDADVNVNVNAVLGLDVSVEGDKKNGNAK
jgi:tRNA threonylcarbamoyladenosine biosynthesis protein TsaE